MSVADSDLEGVGPSGKIRPPMGFTIPLVLLKVIFYFGPFLGAFWGYFLFF